MEPGRIQLCILKARIFHTFLYEITTLICFANYSFFYTVHSLLKALPLVFYFVAVSLIPHHVFYFIEIIHSTTCHPLLETFV